MKFTNVIVASLAWGATAKKYYNREIEKDTTGLLGLKARHIYEPPEDDESEEAGRLRGGGRRTEGEIPVPPPFEESGDETDDEFVIETPFYKAETLDFFKKGIDPEYFEWVNPDEIKPGAVTCGFLKPELGSLEDVNYPTIEVYVCMLFAKTQPAAKGNVFVHCGGPGTLSGCVLQLPGFLGEQNINDYNFLSIDQRGMGRSYPSFVHEECSLNSFVRADNGTIIETVEPPEFQNASSTAGFSDEEFIKSLLPPYARRVGDCWTCTTCGFQFEETQPDGNVTQFHFLEFSGTRQLAEDIFRMRLLLNAPTMHLWGVSYGTGVFSTYATIFPSFTGLLVLDSNVSPFPDHYHQARTGAIGFNERIDYIVFSCTARNVANPGSCPVEDMRKCVGDISALAQEEGFGPGSQEQSEFLGGFISILFTFPDRAQEICDAAAAGDTDTLDSIFAELIPTDPVEDETLTRQAAPDFDASSFPTLDFFGVVYGNPEYYIINAGDQISIQMVRAQDRAGPIYDEDRLAKEVVEINERYTGAGTGQPASRFFSEYTIGYYWPKAIPLPPAGSAFIPGIIIGVLYDPATAYVWAQEMRSAFKSASLLTSQDIFHGVVTGDSSCNRHVVHYFEKGFVDFVDGQVCGADFAGEDALFQIFVPAGGKFLRSR